MSTYSQTIQAGKSWDIGIPGDLIRIISVTGPVDLTVKNNGLPISKATGVLEGYWSKPPGGFNGMLIESATTQTVTVAIVAGEAGYDRAAGVISVANIPATGGAYTNTQKTVTNASAQLLPANSGRRNLLIQNKSLAGSVWLAFGVAATTANGVKLGPGGVYEAPGFYLPTNDIYAIGDIASNAEIVVLEG